MTATKKKKTAPSPYLKEDVDPTHLNICNLCAEFMEAVSDRYFIEVDQGKIEADDNDNKTFWEVQRLCREWKKSAAESEIGTDIVTYCSDYAEYLEKNDGINENMLLLVPPTMLSADFIAEINQYTDLKPLVHFCKQLAKIRGPVLIQ